VNHRKFRNRLNGAIRLNHHNQKVSGTATDFRRSESKVSECPPEYRWSPRWSMVMQSKHGKPDGYLQEDLEQADRKENPKLSG
jgi:hypothetical protein